MFAVEKDRTCLQEVQENGVNVITETDQRWHRCDINSLNRLPEVLAKQKAIVGKAFETLFVRDNKITEAVEGNLMVVKDEIIWTHPANNLIHNTIAGRLVKERLVPDMGMKQVEDNRRAGRGVFAKRWTQSSNLIIPEAVVEIVKADSWRQDPVVPAGYILVQDSLRVGVSEITGYPYQYYRLAAIPKFKNVKRKRKERDHGSTRGKGYK